MADLKLTLELRITQSVLRWGLTALLLASCAPELASESVTLTTYYPAPSGVYTQMITTSNSYLARDGGNVGVFTTNPLHKLDVNGDGNFATTLSVGTNESVGGNVTIGGWQTVAGAETVGGVLQVNNNANVTGTLTAGTLSVTNTSTFNGAATFQSIATFNGMVYANSGVATVQTVSAKAGGVGTCSLVHWAAEGANVGMGCAGYVTNQSGFYSEYATAMELPGNIGGAFCCPFGPGGVQF